MLIMLKFSLRKPHIQFTYLPLQCLWLRYFLFDNSNVLSFYHLFMGGLLNKDYRLIMLRKKL